MFIQINHQPPHLLKHLQAKSAGAINNAIIKLLNDQSKRNILITSSSLTPQTPERAYLNPHHPFYLLIRGYQLFNEPLFQQLFSEKGLSPYCKLLIQSDQFISIRNKIDLREEQGYWQDNHKKYSINIMVLKDIQQLVTRLIIHAQEPAFKTAVSKYHHDTGFTDNLREYVKYVESLYEAYSRLLVIRVDLSYNRNIPIDDETFNIHVKSFLT